MKKAYAEKRFFEWHEDELAVSLRAKSGSYGGGSEVLVVQMVLASIAPNAERTDGSISPTIMHRAGTGGGQLPILIMQEAEDELSESDRLSEPYESLLHRKRTSKSIDNESKSGSVELHG